MRDLTSRFEEIFGAAPGGLRHASAPGRVNLIGEHTDYNDGFVLPMAIDRRITIAFRHGTGCRIRVWSENYAEMDQFDPAAPEPSDKTPWSNYVRGTAWALKEAGLPLRPFDGVLHGDIPIGAGLSSSAALEVASALALSTPDRPGETDRKKLALICQRAENEFVGVNCGIMDQFVSLHAEKDNAVMIDCRSLDYRLLPLDSNELTIVVANTMAEHELAGTAYNERRSTCERAAARINGKAGGVRRLRDVSPEMLRQCRDILTPTEYRRAEHVVTENARTLCAVDALRDRNWQRFGELMVESHCSLRDGYEVSCGELDVMVELALACDGVYGSRMTGGGFGGCTVSLASAQKSEKFAARLARDYERETGTVPEVFLFKAAGGASCTAGA